jgi:hypothetical protein
MPRLVAALALALGLLSPTRADAYMLCSFLGICPYFSPGFSLTVVDAESGKPVEGVYAWAEWVQNASHGLNGPIMIQEATSDVAGRLSFPRWGPRLGYRAGLDIGADPAVILFKAGYLTQIVGNGERPGVGVTDAIRGFTHNGETLRLELFRGSPAEWVTQLRRLVHPALTSFVSDAQRDKFRPSYLKRLEHAERETEKLPQDIPEIREFRSSLRADRRFLTGEPQ